MLLIDVLRLNVAAGKFQLHDLVIMPDHLHLLMTLPGDMTIEKAMQFDQGWVLLPSQQGIRISRRGLATWIFRGADK